jgi:fatty acid-binding protein DegV
VVTDSTGVATPSDGTARVRVVPVTVLLPDREVADGAAPAELVHEALRRQEPVKTRAPSVVDYVEAVEDAEGDAAVVITPAARFTAMWRNACNAVYLTDRPVAVVDSRTAATGQALVVAAAHGCAAGGGSLADVVAAAERASRRVRMVATLGSVGRIVETGILPPSTLGPALGPASPGPAGQLPLFRLAGGVVDVVRLAAHGADPVVELAELWRRERGPDGEGPRVFTAGDGAGASRLAELVGARSVERPSPAMTVYTGADVLGLAWLAGTDGTDGTDRPSPRTTGRITRP